MALRALSLILPIFLLGCDEMSSLSNTPAVQSLKSLTLILLRSEYNSFYYPGKYSGSIDDVEARWRKQSEQMTDPELTAAVSDAFSYVLDERGYWDILCGPSAAESEYQLFKGLSEGQKYEVARGMALVFLSLIRGRFNV